LAVKYFLAVKCYNRIRIRQDEVIHLNIDNLEVAKAIFDPKLERIIRSVKHDSKTVKEIASELEEKQSRLYYPIQKLLNLGLIMVEEEKLIGNIIEKYYTSKHLHDDELTFSFEGEFAKQHQEYLIAKVMYSLNKGLNVLKTDLTSKPSPKESNAMFTEYCLDLTPGEWQHLNEEIRSLMNSRDKKKQTEGTQSYKMMLMTYRDEDNS
jgi:DNA-binding transcriptional ArsR family regulator